MAFSQFLRTYWPQNSTERLRSWWWSAGSSKPRRIASWTVGVVVALVLLAVVAAFFIDEPLRRRMEANLNTALKGYTVHIGKLDFHPIGLALDLEDVSILQKENPDPPVAQVARLSASVAWRAILSGHVVADLEIDHPKLHINLKQARQEIEDKTPAKERGWQQALEEIYPLKINHFAISNGELTYIDEGPFRPLELTAVNLYAENIRNVSSAEGVYPSPMRAEATVFQRGKLRLSGHADFLAEPHVSFKTDLALQDIALDYFQPILQRENFTVKGGLLSANGNMEYAANTKYINVSELRATEVKADYINRAAEAAPKTAAKNVDNAAKEYSDSPTLAVTVNQIFITGSLGFVNMTRTPHYRVFWEPCEIQISNFTNRSEQGTMKGRLTGRFLGTGNTVVNVTARPNKGSPDIDLNVAIQETDMKAMNDLFRSYGNFDVVAGRFSFFSEMTVRSGHIDGYVKPLFQDVDVYDSRQDKDKGIFRKLYEGVIGGISMLFRNTPREEVATNIPISGELSNPNTSVWQTVIGLVQNAFFKAILPGFEREAGGTKNRPNKSSDASRS